MNISCAGESLGCEGYDVLRVAQSGEEPCPSMLQGIGDRRSDDPAQLGCEALNIARFSFVRLERL
ncbi:hypothetical protein BSZ22_32485 [Bradyrhizobium canariense]|nr:hypothetical protein BSZ22_32485 [Bradyrhizobium canariense]OSI79231.1 hypothetical protein BSZ23_15890 [Bradyrhizobium canariense]